ncbi:MAG: hypothetical protein IJB15_12010 [Clostridia bacterium]|nr:hypothetical protein [Clostridia bacterium]
MNNMDEERKIRLCPDCGREMDPGFLQISEYAAFNKQRQILSLRPDEEGEVQLTGDGFFSDHRGNFHGWICRDCGLILFDYTNNRAGMGKPVLDVIAQRVDAFFEAADRLFEGKPEPNGTTPPDGTEEASVPAEETSKKRIITASGVQPAEEEEKR